ncbi:MAG TPA: DegV family protein [Epulopiscium sp.]|nr:DegV family protein [Candidatus Epulonipiscium sp.]
MIKIMADSTCDLPEDIVKKYNIGIAPLTITIEGKEYRDRIDLTPDEFYHILQTLEESPTTSMPSPSEYLQIINGAIEEGHTQILCICMSSGTSGSYQSAALAKEYFYEKFPDSKIEIHVVDSKCMSHGSGYLILKAAMLRDEGFTFKDLVAFTEVYKKNIKHFLSVDDLDNLIRSGRLTNASAFIGKILKIKPIMSMRKGKGAIVAKERGSKKVLNHYVKEFNIRNDEEITDFIIIGYTSNRAIAEILKQKISQETNFKGEIYIMQMGMAVGTHVGSGGVSMYFVEKGHRKDGLLVNELNALIEKKNEMVEKLKNRNK